jgi:hypothetical protein
LRCWKTSRTWPAIESSLEFEELMMFDGKSRVALSLVAVVVSSFSITGISLKVSERACE